MNTVLELVQTDWLNYWSEPLPENLCIWIKELLDQIQHPLPVIGVTENGSVAFTWSDHYPKKELEIWLYDQPEYYAEWLISHNGQNQEDVAYSNSELMKVVNQYQAL